MPLGIWNQQWLSQNSQRAYPFVDWATRWDVSDSVQIPNDFLVALYFPVHAGLNVRPDRFYLMELDVTALGYTLYLGYDDGTAQTLVAKATIAKNTHTENATYALPGIDDFDDCVGRVAIGPLAGIEELPAGQYLFAYEDTNLEVDAIRPQHRGLTSLTVTSGSDVSARLYGDITLVAGSNMQISVDLSNATAPIITLSAISGEGLNQSCDCATESTGPPIRYINGIAPLPNGNFRIIGDTCLQISALANGLQLEDTCSQPCCGCEELTSLITQIDRFADGVVTLQTFVNDLRSEVTQMSSAVLASRLGDVGCLEC